MPKPWCYICGVNVAGFVALGLAPVPPQRTSEGEEGEERCVGKVMEANVFFAPAGTVAAGSEGIGSSAAAPAAPEQLQKEGEKNFGAANVLGDLQAGVEMRTFFQCWCTKYTTGN